jgi:hypothetical protein
VHFAYDGPEGWEHFAAFPIGMGMFFEEIVYILDAPACPSGSVFAVGEILIGWEGGTGPFKLDGSLVLAATFTDWLAHLERWEWQEPVLAGMGDLPEPKHREACRYYLALNPDLDVGPAKESS